MFIVVLVKKKQKYLFIKQNIKVMAKATFTSKEIVLNEHEIFMIKNHGGLCLASTISVFKKSNIDFSDIESLNNVFRKHKWGSDADRKYRKSAINKALNSFSKNALNYITL